MSNETNHQVKHTPLYHRYQRSFFFNIIRTYHISEHGTTQKILSGKTTAPYIDKESGKVV